MADVKSEISRILIFDVKYVTFLTSKDDFLVAAKNGSYNLETFISVYSAPYISSNTQWLDFY